jgi:sortase (surface protein transpeptidase)
MDPFLVIGPPVRVRIPSIGVDAPVELVGLTSDRAMDVPKTWANVGWYRDGYRPGEPGNAVLAGHLDTNSGGPAVFWSLDKLQPGDEVIVDYANGDGYTFAVEGQETYEYDAQGPIIDRIFGESLTADLNLVTCDGAWDHGQATYSHRLVVFCTLLPEKTVGSAAGRSAPEQ